MPTRPETFENFEQAIRFFRASTEELLKNREICELLRQIDLGFVSTESSESLPRVILENLFDNVVSGFEMIGPHLFKGARILEVGGGAGLTYLCLLSLGYNIISIEPALVGHDGSYRLGGLLADFFGFEKSGWLPYSANEVEKINNNFDVIFSQNVLEHVANLGEAMRLLSKSLATNGVMVHNFPNYFFPYDPHFGIPLVPFFPKSTQIFSQKLRSSELWNGLNFVTSFGLDRMASRLGLRVNYDQDHFYRTWLRLGKEVSFRDKHPLLFKLYVALERSGFLKIFRLVPARVVSPVQVVLSKG